MQKPRLQLKLAFEQLARRAPLLVKVLLATLLLVVVLLGFRLYFDSGSVPQTVAPRAIESEITLEEIDELLRWLERRTPAVLPPHENPFVR